MRPHTCTGSSGSTLKPRMADELSLKATTLLLGLTFQGVLTRLNSVSSIWGAGNATQHAIG